MADTVGAAQHLKCVFMPDIGLLTEFERSMIQKRVRAALSGPRPKVNPLGRPRIGAQLEQRILELKRARGSARKTAEPIWRQPSTVQSIKSPFGRGW